MNYTVSQVAAMAGVTVRALHHYDEIGLVSPAHRSAAGYRLYDRADLERLQEVLVLRQLEIPLRTIGDLLDRGADRTESLRLQAAALRSRRDRLDRIIATVEKTLGSTKGRAMPDTDLFGGFDPAEYEDEVNERWGETDAHKESSRRTSSYTEADWAEIGAEIEEIEAGLAALLVAGVAAESTRAIALAERARLHIDRWFYPCSPQMHAMLADGYVTDPRFKKHYEDRQPGLAHFVRDAIAANLDD